MKSTFKVDSFFLKTLFVLVFFFSQLQTFASTEPFCSDLLIGAKEIQFTSVMGVPGFKVYLPGISKIRFSKLLKLAKRDKIEIEPHEIISTQRFAIVLHKLFQEELVLVPNIERMSIPGFDGIIINKFGKKIAYFSLKTLVESQNIANTLEQSFDLDRESRSKAMDITADAIAKSVKYRQLKNWKTFNNHMRDEKRQRKWERIVMQIFEIQNEKIPVRILVDLNKKSNDFPSAEELFTVSGRLTKEKEVVESVTYLRKEEIILVNPSVSISD